MSEGPMDGLLAGMDWAQVRTLNKQKIAAGDLEAKQKSDMAAAMAERAEQDDGSQPKSLADYMDEMATIAAKTGNIETATKMAAKGSEIRQKTADATKKGLDNQLSRWNTSSALLADVNDQASWQRANQAYGMVTGQPSPFAELPYSPELVKTLQTNIQSAKDKALTEAANAQTNVRKAELPLIKARTDFYNARADALGKTGGVKPRAADLKAATDLIESQYGSISPEESRIVGRQVVDRAADLLKRNPALTKEQAITRAYHEKRAAGTFAAYRQRPAKKAKGNWKMPDGSALTPGMAVGGYRWAGGDPKDPSSWEAVNASGGEEAESLVEGEE